jgi:hypothetical protein
MKSWLLAGLVLVLCTASAYAEMFEGAESFTSHFESLGYKITPSKENKNFEAKHAKHLNVTVSSYRDGVLVAGSFDLSDQGLKDRSKVLELANRMNVSSASARVYIDKNKRFTVECWWPGSYDPIRFGLLMQDFNTTGKAVFEDDDAKVLLK